jgi:hypothetical protein
MTHDGTEELLSGIEGENLEVYLAALKDALRRIEEVRPVAEKKLEEMLKMYPADHPLVVRFLEARARWRREKEDYLQWSEKHLRERLGIDPSDGLVTICRLAPEVLGKPKRDDPEDEANCTPNTDG